jgi:hypothetical protein
MKVSVSSQINIPAHSAWVLVKRSSTLAFVTRGLMGFRSESKNFPEFWVEGSSEQMRIYLFGFIPAWKHRIFFNEISSSKMRMLTEESGGLITTWNHLILVESKSNSQCLYTDTVEIDAGLLTPFVWMYASAFYRYRQLRWHKLAKIHVTVR